MSMIVLIASIQFIFAESSIPTADGFTLEVSGSSVVDFKKEMIGETFSIKNPKASASCGCGLSFSV